MQSRSFSYFTAVALRGLAKLYFLLRSVTSLSCLPHVRDTGRIKTKVSDFNFSSVLNLVFSGANSEVMSDLSVKEEQRGEPVVGPEEELEIDPKQEPKIELLKEEPKNEPK